MRKNRRTGFTLLECLIASALFTTLAGISLIAVGHARVVRSNARERVHLLILAQAEMEQLSAKSELIPTVGFVDRTLETDPNVTISHHISVHESGALEVEVTVQRLAAQGLQPVYIATLLPQGGTP